MCFGGLCKALSPWRRSSCPRFEPKGQGGLDWLLFHVVLKKEPGWFQAVIFCREHPSGQVLDTN